MPSPSSSRLSLVSIEGGAASSAALAAAWLLWVAPPLLLPDLLKRLEKGENLLLRRVVTWMNLRFVIRNV